MNFSTETDGYVEQCVKLENEIEECLKQLQNNTNDRRNLIQNLKKKIDFAKDLLTCIQMESIDASDKDEQEKCYNEYEKHNDEILKLEQQFKSSLNDHEKEIFKSLSVDEINNYAQKIQSMNMECF